MAENNLITVTLTENMNNFGDAGDEIEVSPGQAYELAILGRIEGKAEDFYGEGMLGEVHNELTQTSSADEEEDEPESVEEDEDEE